MESQLFDWSMLSLSILVLVYLIYTLIYPEKF